LYPSPTFSAAPHDVHFFTEDLNAQKQAFEQKKPIFDPLPPEGHLSTSAPQFRQATWILIATYALAPTTTIL
jgi:hypothetical protein